MWNKSRGDFELEETRLEEMIVVAVSIVLLQFGAFEPEETRLQETILVESFEEAILTNPTGEVVTSPLLVPHHHHCGLVAAMLPQLPLQTTWLE